MSVYLIAPVPLHLAVKTTALRKITSILDMTTFSELDMCRRFGGTRCLHLQDRRKEAWRKIETSGRKGGQSGFLGLVKTTDSRPKNSRMGLGHVHACIENLAGVNIFLLKYKKQ